MNNSKLIAILVLTAMVTCVVGKPMYELGLLTAMDYQLNWDALNYLMRQFSPGHIQRLMMSPNDAVKPNPVPDAKSITGLANPSADQPTNSDNANTITEKVGK